MSIAISPLNFVILAISGWLNRYQQQILDYLKEENRVLKEQLGGRRPRLPEHYSASESPHSWSSLFLTTGGFSAL